MGISHSFMNDGNSHEIQQVKTYKKNYLLSLSPGGIFYCESIRNGQIGSENSSDLESQSLRASGQICLLSLVCP